MLRKVCLFTVAICLCINLLQAQGSASKVKVLAEYPHDISSYTQGLFFCDSLLYESTGEYGQSHFIISNPLTGKVLRKWRFQPKYFLEGSCMVGKNIYILTWQEHVCFVYNLENAKGKFKKIGQAQYASEGWGLTFDGKNLIMSDGSDKLRFLDPSNFYCTSTLSVTLNGKPLSLINELEYIEDKDGGKIWANVYLSDNIVIINPLTGCVEHIIDCSGLLPDSLKTAKTDVLNGIAYNPLNSSIFITGKHWPRLYKIAKPK